MVTCGVRRYSFWRRNPAGGGVPRWGQPDHYPFLHVTFSCVYDNGALAFLPRLATHLLHFLVFTGGRTKDGTHFPRAARGRTYLWWTVPLLFIPRCIILCVLCLLHAAFSSVYNLLVPVACAAPRLSSTNGYSLDTFSTYSPWAFFWRRPAARTSQCHHHPFCKHTTPHARASHRAHCPLFGACCLPLIGILISSPITGPDALGIQCKTWDRAAYLCSARHMAVTLLSLYYAFTAPALLLEGLMGGTGQDGREQYLFVYFWCVNKYSSIPGALLLRYGQR